MGIVYSMNELVAETVSFYDFLRNEKTAFDKVQRDYEWDSQHESFVRHMVKVAIDKIGYVDCGFIIINRNGEIRKCSDGHHRMILIKVFVDCINKVIREYYPNITEVDSPQLYYENNTFNAEWVKYQEGQKSIYSKLANYITGVLKENLNHIEDIIDVIKNKCFVQVKTQSDARESYQGANGGLATNQRDTACAWINDYADKYNIPVDYNTSRIKLIVEAYFYAKTGKVYRFNKTQIDNFFEMDVTKSKATFMDFANFVESANEFFKTPICKVLDLLQAEVGEKLLLSYIANGKDVISGKNEEMVKLIKSIIVAYGTLKVCKKSIDGDFRKLFDTYAARTSTICPQKMVQGIKEWFDNNQAYSVRVDDFRYLLSAPQKNEKLVTALKLFELWTCNVNFIFDCSHIQLDHVCPQAYMRHWLTHGWSEEECEAVCNHFGNKILLLDKLNQQVSNHYLNVKGPAIRDFYKKNHLMNSPCNGFDFDEYENRRKAYADERTEIFINFWRGLPLSSSIIKDNGLGWTNPNTNGNKDIIDCRKAS